MTASPPNDQATESAEGQEALDNYAQTMRALLRNVTDYMAGQVDALYVPGHNVTQDQVESWVADDISREAIGLLVDTLRKAGRYHEWTTPSAE